eukprot:SAG11_NODE_18709_length_483_cov_1.132812_1_plen_40_part_10
MRGVREGARGCSGCGEQDVRGLREQAGLLRAGRGEAEALV